jgi:pimeloyl-ACP methyl ester carboxylesterase
VALAEVNGIRLYHEVHGDGPPLVLIAGLPQTVADWFPFADRLAERFRVVAFDNRGNGRSDRPEGLYTIPLYAEDAVALLDRLGIRRAHVFGLSMGGMIAQEMALRYPDRVDRLVLGCTHCGGRHALPPGPEVQAAFGLETRDWGLRIRTLAPFGLSERFKAAHRAEYEAFVVRKARDVQSYEAYRRTLGAILRHDAFDRLPGIRHPTLVVTGSDDVVVPVGNAELLARAIPEARLVTIAGAGHLFYIEDPGRTLAALEEFLGVPPTRG